MSLRARLQRIRRKARSIMGINRRNLSFVYADNSRDRFPLVDDKAKCKALLSAAGIPVPEAYQVVRRRVEIRACLEALKSRAAFAVKPGNGSGGQGILLVKRLDSGKWGTTKGEILCDEDLAFHMGLIMSGMFSLSQLCDEVLVEELIIDHPVFRAIHGTKGVSDVRTLACRGRVVMAMLRLPSRRSGGVANLHSGGIGVGVDLASGTTTNAVQSGRMLERHPDTDAPLIGVQVPYWRQIVENSEKMNGVFGMGYLGVDTALDERKGPLVLEVNARPGLEIQNANRRGLWGVLRSLMERGELRESRL